jgi:hypothetical protein
MSGGGLTNLMDPVDDLVFPIALVEAQLEVRFGGQRPAIALQVGQSFVAVDMRLPLPQQV